MSTPTAPPEPDAGVSPDIFQLWAKTDRDDPRRWHALPYHLIEVGAVAKVMWDEVVPLSRKRHWAARLGLGDDPDLAGRFLAFIAATHDLGKCTPVFEGQRLAEVQRKRLQASLGLSFIPEHYTGPQVFQHGTASRVALPPILQSLWPELGKQRFVADRYALITGGHHGKIPSNGDAKSVRDKPRGKGSGVWESMRHDLVTWLRDAFQLRGFAFPAYLPSYVDALELAGFISVADWIGSDDRFFTYRTEPSDPVAAFGEATKRAQQALGALRFFEQPPVIPATTFCDAFPKELFPAIRKPNTTQAATEAAVSHMASPGIVIVEAQTGSGKTEAALFAALYAQQQWKSRGYYIAMPTMATSDQLYDRVRRFLSRHNADDRYLNLVLLHGHAALSAEREMLERQLSEDSGEVTREVSDEETSRIRAAPWFYGRKRGSLAPLGVGTIDQVLMSVLQMRHNTVRIFGFAGKTIIFDEVHSYDIYMSELFAAVLKILGALGSPVVILTATLPAHQTRRLLGAYAEGAGWNLPIDKIDNYPRISTACESGITSVSIHNDETVKSKSVSLMWRHGDANAIDWRALAGELKDRLSAGGNVAIICNTVREAQRAYSELKVAWDDPEELDLFHARFRFVDRHARQKRVVGAFEKGSSQRPHRRIVVATQVIEQSLDLDFDLLISMFCPTDLLLQRAGRLHRHSDNIRPEKLKLPEVWLLAGELDAATHGSTFHRGSTYVYEEHILLRSWLALRGRRTITVPADVERLIEDTYGEDIVPPEDVAPEWTRTLDKMNAAIARDRQVAAKVLIAMPETDDPETGKDALQRRTYDLKDGEDEPELHPEALARTRLGPPSFNLVLARQSELESIGWSAGQEPDRTQTIQLLDWSVSIADHNVTRFCIDSLETPSEWRESPHLRHQRLVVLSEEGTAHLEETLVGLDPDLGVVIKRTGEESDVSTVI
jgi:CRISPR-associated endonuclease/helicase Cas3